MSDACGLVRLLRTAPRVNHSSLPPELWLEIFRYATYVPRVRGLSPGDPFEPQRPSNFAWGVNTPVSSLATKRSLVLVCHPWRCLATELLYEHVVISSKRRAYLLGRSLQASDLEAHKAHAQSAVFATGDVSRGHARWVRHVEIHDCSRTSKTALFWNAVAAILSLLLEIFSRYLGNSIRGLYWEEGVIPEGEASLLNPTFLPKYQSLRVLDVRKFKLQDPARFPVDPALKISLPSIVDLLIPTCPALLLFASKLELPRLRRLVLDSASARRNASPSLLSALDDFLAAHGQKLTTLELLPISSLFYHPSPISITAFLQPDVCPSLDTLVFDCREKVISASSPPSSSSSPAKKHGAVPRFPPSPPPHSDPPVPVLSEPHRSLRRVGIRGMGISRLYPNRPTQAQTHLRAFLAHRSLFPALETVRTLGLLVDASTDQFARDIFIWWTEKFEEEGLDLQDGEGVVWLYTDPIGGKEVVTEEQVVPGDEASLVHKSNPLELIAAKAVF